MSVVGIAELKLSPEPGLGQNLMVVDEKGETRHLRFHTREQLADFHEKMVMRQWEARMGVGTMRQEQARLYREKVEAARQQIAGGGGPSWADLLAQLSSENDGSSERQEEAGQNMLMLQESMVHGSGGDADRPDLPIFSDSMSTQNYRQLSIFRDILHTIVCAGILPYVGGSQANPEGNVLERSNLMQSLMGTQIVGHILRLASRVITLTGRITDTVTTSVVGSMTRFFGESSQLGDICIRLFRGVSSLTSTAMTVGTLVVAGGNVLYQFLPASVRSYVGKYLLQPVRAWWSGTALSRRSGETIAGLATIFETFQVSSWFGTLVGFLANPQASMSIGVTYACINLMNHFCGDKTAAGQDGSVGGFLRTLCTRTAEFSNMVGLTLTITSISISIIHSVQLVLFGKYRNNLYYFQWMPHFRDDDSWAWYQEQVDPLVRSLSLPCLPQLEQQVYRVNLDETDFVTRTLGAEAAAMMRLYDRNQDGTLNMRELSRFTADVRAMEVIPRGWTQLRGYYFSKLREARGPERRRALLRTIRNVGGEGAEHTRGTYMVRLEDGTLLHARDAPADTGYARFLSAFVPSTKPSVMDMSFENHSATSIRTRLARDLEQLGITNVELPPASGGNYDPEHIDVVLHDIVRQNRNSFGKQGGSDWLRANLPRGRNSSHLRDEWAEIIASSSGSASRAVIVDTSDWKGEGYNYEMLQRFGKTFGYEIEESKSWYSSLWPFRASNASPDVTVVLGKNTVVTNVQRDYIGHYVEQLQQHPTADIMLFKDATRDNGISSDFYLLRNRGDGIKNWDPQQPIETNLQSQGQCNIDALVVSRHSDVDLSVVNPSRADQFLGKDNITQQHDPDRISNCFCVHINAETDYVRSHQQTIVRRAGDDTPPEGWNSFADGMQRVWGRMSWWVSGSDETLLPEHSVGWASYLGRWFDKNHPYNVQRRIVEALPTGDRKEANRLVTQRLKERFPLHAKTEQAYATFDASVRRMYLDRYLKEHGYYVRDRSIPDVPEDLFQLFGNGNAEHVSSIKKEIETHNQFRASFDQIRETYNASRWSDLKSKYGSLSDYAQTCVNDDWQRASRVNTIRTSEFLKHRQGLESASQLYLRGKMSWEDLSRRHFVIL